MNKLRKLTSTDGIIREDAVRALDPNLVYNSHDMEMILMQLNIMQSYLKYTQKTKDYLFY